jgi:glycosyltransferase involved in cell wall biosynthesis
MPSVLPKVSLVIPVYNEGIEVIYKLKEALKTLEKSIERDYTLEIICVDDGSHDTYRKVYLQNFNKESNWTLVTFTRNFGKEAALRAGFVHSSGDAVIPIDADLQDPIELIPEMLRLWKIESYPVVLARRSNRASDKFLKRFFANSFYKLITTISEIDIPNNVGDFRLLDRKVVNELIKLPERNLFMKGMYAWLGFNYTIIEYPRLARIHGKTKFSFFKLVKFALDGIVSFSSLPLRIWSGIGILVAFLSFVYSVTIVVLKIMGKIEIPGYASLIVISLSALSLNLICFGVFGEYLSRMFIEIKGRPHYVIDSVERFKTRT